MTAQDSSGNTIYRLDTYTDVGLVHNDGQQHQNGFTDWKTASKPVIPESNIGELEFSIFDRTDDGVDSGVLIDNVKVEQYSPLYVVPNGQSLTGPSQRPLVEFADQSTTFDSVLVASGNGPNGAPSVSLSGPLLKAVRSDLNVPYSLLGLLNGSRLNSSSTDPLVWLQGGNYSLSTLKGTAIFDFWGTKTTPNPDIPGLRWDRVQP